VWDTAAGLAKMFQAGGVTGRTIRERCRVDGSASERASWSDYMATINAGRPVLVTFCYDPAAASGLASAKRRVSNCFTAVGIGYMDYGDEHLLICHDGASSTSDLGPAAADRISPQALGINTSGKPWSQPGTSLYKWSGSHTNLAMVFVE